MARAAAALAGALALAALARWAWAVTLRGPVLYGEGAVAHAALLARESSEYAPFEPPIFVAANYTPLFFHLAAPDPFVVGRLVSIASALSVAVILAWRARPAGPAVTLGVAAAWLALAPVAIWGAAVKPDMLAVALTVAAAHALARPRPRPAIAAALLVLAIAAKPTAALPALAFAGWLAASRAWTPLATYAATGIAGAALLVLLTPGGARALREHVIERNALAWDAGQLAGLLLLGALLVGVVVAGALATRPRGAPLAYVIGAAGVVVLAGREGATINYLLDLAAASLLALADAAPRLRAAALAPAALVAQLAVGAVVVDPYGMGTRVVTTGRWGDPARIAVVRSLPEGALLVEDAGLLIAAGRRLVVDDLFLWSRLVARGSLDPAPLERAVREGGFARIVAEADLDRIATAPGYVAQRWHAALVDSVRARYVLDRVEAGLYVYRPR